MLTTAFSTPLVLPNSSVSRVHKERLCSVQMARRPSRKREPPPSGSTSKATQRPSRSAIPQKRQRNGPASQSQSEYHRAMQLSARADKRAARGAFRSALETTPDDGRLWLGWAQMEARSGRMDLARDVFRRGVEQDPSNVRLVHAWAVEEDRNKHTDVAHRLFRRCLEIDPGDGIVWQSFALSQERAGNTSAARTLFEQGVKADPKNAYLWSAWGVLEQRHGNLELASELFDHAIRLNPRHVRTYQAWAITKEKMGKHNESQKLFRHALDVNPRSAPTYQAYGLFEARRGRLDHARNLFQSGIDVDGDHAPIWHAWAVMEEKEGNYERARELFDKGVNAAPNSTPMLRAWAAMELKLGHIDKSRDWMVPPGSRKVPSKEEGTSTHNKEGMSRKRNAKQISVVGENLKMLRLMIERRTDEDVKTVMKWLDKRARQDRGLYDAIAERKESDSRIVTEWIHRRSQSDIESFREWLANIYEKDSRIGVYLFNMDIPLTSPKLRPVPIADRIVEPGTQPEAQKPIEWFKLDEKPAMALHNFDEQLYFRKDPTDYSAGVYFLGQIAEGLADRAALFFVLGALTFGLLGACTDLFEKGYSPSGDTTQAEETQGAVPAPSGVDAHLYEEGGAESVARKASISKRLQH